MAQSKLNHGWRIFRRSTQMVYAGLFAAAVFVREWVRRRGGEAPAMHAAGRAFVRLATQLGATFIKIGQIASTRGDLLPRPLIVELSTLQDQVPAFPFDEVRRTIETELQAPLAQLFSSFDEQPVAAASVAQVHRAVWRPSGEVVAVKVRRPDILEKVQLDRSILLFVARLLEKLVPSLRLISLEVSIRNFCDAVEQQIHLKNEADHNVRFTANFADDPDVHFPRLVPDGCSDAVLTMEFIEGIREPELEAHGADIRAIVEGGMRCVCRMIFSHGFVHSDLHPGNMRFFPPHRVVLLDLGLVGSLSDADRLMTARTLFAFATGDGVTVARLFYENAPYKAVQDYPKFEAEMAAMVTTLRSRDLGNTQVTLEIGRIFDILRRHHIQARGHMTMINLALMTAEGLGKRLDPDLSLADAALPFLAEALGVSSAAGQGSTARLSNAAQ
ncbi:MAG: AarF/ABC1/UbiB kinase family protein [Deltaproteobacteria bacterium]|nr:AarF/ABC1/UbiB kinase family protein [Deltaproteobacteria bacterium]